MSLTTIFPFLTVLMRKRANPSAYYRFMRFLQSTSTFLDSGSVDHTYTEAWTTPTRTDWTHPVISCANPTWREHSWGGILNSESAAFLHICVPCKLTKQEQSKQPGNAPRKATRSSGEGPGAWQSRMGMALFPLWAKARCIPVTQMLLGHMT